MKYRIPRTGKLVLYVEVEAGMVSLKSMNQYCVLFKDFRGEINIDVIRILGRPVRMGIYQFMVAIFDKLAYGDIKAALEYGSVIEIPENEMTYDEFLRRIEKRLERLE